MSTTASVAGARPYAGLIFALWIAEITGSFETAMILAAMKELIAEYGDPSRVGWLVTAYLIVGAAVAALVGRMGDVFGRRRMILVMLAIAAVGSLMSALAPNFGWLLAGRVLQGMTGAILPLCVGLVRENMPPDKVPMGIGLMISGASIGTAAGLVLGGWIVDHYSWQGVFYASVGFCLAAWIGIRLFVPPSPVLPTAKRVDWIAGLLFAPGVVALLYYVTNGARHGWTESSGLMALGVGTLLLAYWLHRSLTHPEPLIDVRLFRNRNILVANLVGVLVALGALQITLVFSILLQAPQWTMVGLGVSATVAGLAKLPSNILATFAGPLSGWLTGRGGGRMAMVIGGGITTAGWLLAYALHDDLLTVIVVLCVISFGTTMLFAVAPTIIADAAPPERTSEVSGMLAVVRGLCMGIGAQLVTTLLASDTVTQAGGTETYPSEAAFGLTILVIAALCLAATLLAFALPKGRTVTGVSDA